MAKRGDVKPAPLSNGAEDHDEEMEAANLTAICIVGQSLRSNSALVKDVQTFGFKVFYSE